MNYDDFLTIFDDIPSGCSSGVSDDEDDDCGVSNNPVDNDMDILYDDMEERPYISDWESEDEVPLSELQKKIKVTWTKDTSNICKHAEFKGNPGPNVPDCIATPTEMFLHLFPEKFIEEIVFQTNLYATQKGGGSISFVSTTKEEMKQFLGLNLIMGIKRLPSYRDYWSSRDDLRDFFIGEVMSRERFSWLLSNLHMVDNTLQPNNAQDNFDPLFKIRPLINILSETFLGSLNPAEFQSVDESMIRFKGRSCIRQYMPMKPIKRGYKVWVRSDKTGYMCQFQIYTGKVNNTTEKSLGRRVVQDLTRSLVGQSHKVYFDNFFNSVDLQKQLQSEGIYASGTVRKLRKNLPEFAHDKNMKRGDNDWYVSVDGLTSLKWMDKRSVLMLGNYGDPSVGDTTSRREKNGIVEVQRPLLIKDYNMHMGYVDKFDMLKSLYEINRKSHKWWHRIFWYFVDASVVNAYILHNLRCQSNIKLKFFRLSVANGLIGAISKRSKQRQSSSNQRNYKRVIPHEKRYDKCLHMPDRTTSLRCAYCSTTKEVHRTIWKCVTCNVGLCLNKERNCFKLFHEK